MKTTTNFLSKDITIFDDVFDVTDLNAIIEDVADKNYRVGEVDFIGAVPSGVVCDLSDSITEKLLVEFLNKQYPDRFEIQRAYCNLFAANEHANFHEDRSDYTLMFYPSREWNPDAGGETKFLLNTDLEIIENAGTEFPLLIGVPPIPNRIVLFKGKIPHSASPLRNNQRFTAVLKLKEIK
jgi:hypothetical protein